MKILFVDDDPASRKLIQKGLAADQISVELAEDGPSAIELIRKERYDTIILDIMMPGVDGLQVGKAIRGDSMNRDTPIILLTAHPLALREKAAKKLQPAASLTKPIKLDKLASVIRETVAKQQTE